MARQAEAGASPPKAPTTSPDLALQRGERDRMICSTSAVLTTVVVRLCAQRAKPLVTMLGAGTGTRTPGLLITSNPSPSAVLSRATAGSVPSPAERQRPSYLLSVRRPGSMFSRVWTVRSAGRGPTATTRRVPSPACTHWAVDVSKTVLPPLPLRARIRSRVRHGKKISSGPTVKTAQKLLGQHVTPSAAAAALMG
jgi:hypothetical protein